MEFLKDFLVATGLASWSYVGSNSWDSCLAPIPTTQPKSAASPRDFGRG